MKRMRDKKKTGQGSKFPNLVTSDKPQRSTNFRGQSQPRFEGKNQTEPKKLDSIQSHECSGYGHYANECADRIRNNKAYNVTLSDDEYEEDQEFNTEENNTSLTVLLAEKCNLQVNPVGVATPGRNIPENPVCLNSTNEDDLTCENLLEEDDEEMTLEGVQKLYEELYVDWIERNKLIITLSKENIELKSAVSKLEVIQCKKDVELGNVKGELEKTSKTLAKFNSNSSTLDSILMMGKDDDKAGLGYNQSGFETGESSKQTIFVKASGQSSKNHVMGTIVKNLPTKGKVTGHNSTSKKRRYVCHYCRKPGQNQTLLL